MNTLIAKQVVKNQFWIVTDGDKKVGNVTATGSGYEVKVNGGTSFFESKKHITNIDFQAPLKVSESVVSDYPTVGHAYNMMYDVKRKIHLFTTEAKSKCYHVAGWFNVQTGIDYTTVLCPKYIFIQRYNHSGPYKTKEEAETALNKV